MAHVVRLQYADDWPVYPAYRQIERLAAADRETIGCRFGEPCDPRRLVDIFDVDSLLETKDAYEQLFQRPMNGTFDGLVRWSGITMETPGGSYLMMINPTHSAARRALSIVHEFGHLVRNHKPVRVDLANGITVTRHSDQQEKEATLYGLGVLVPYAPLYQMLRQGATIRGIAHFYGVSMEAIVMKMKMKLTGLWGI
jgi:hypothetical protein